MKRLKLLALCLCAIGASAQESRSVDLTYDQAWSTVAQSLILQGLSIADQDKDAGFIKVEGAFKNGDNFNCERAAGARDSRTYEVNVALSPEQDGTMVSINALASERRYRNKKFIFFTVGRVWDKHECPSTGKIERTLFDSLSSKS